VTSARVQVLTATSIAEVFWVVRAVGDVTSNLKTLKLSNLGHLKVTQQGPRKIGAQKCRDILFA
jgi:hypothetical protein